MTDKEYAELAHKLSAAFSALPQLLDFEKTTADHHAQLERLHNEKARLIDSYRVQARSEAAGEADEIRAKGKSDASAMIIDAQAKVHQHDEEVRAKQKRSQELDAKIERQHRVIAENDAHIDRLRQALAS
jgi:hypothetical protein